MIGENSISRKTKIDHTWIVRPRNITEREVEILFVINRILFFLQSRKLVHSIARQIHWKWKYLIWSPISHITHDNCSVVFLVQTTGSNHTHTHGKYYVVSTRSPMLLFCDFAAHVIAVCQFEDNFCGWKSFSLEGEGGWKLSSQNLDLKGKLIP